MKPPTLTIFTIDNNHIKYILFINDNMLFREFITNIIETNPYFNQLKNVKFELNINYLLPTMENGIIHIKIF